MVHFGQSPKQQQKKTTQDNEQQMQQVAKTSAFCISFGCIRSSTKIGGIWWNVKIDKRFNPTTKEPTNSI